MNKHQVISIFATVLIASCGQEKSIDHAKQETNSTKTNELSRQDAEKLLDQIKSGMNIDEIQKILPTGSKIERTPVIGHGGIWMECLLGSNYTISFRMSRPIEGFNMVQCKVNSSIRLKDRKSGKLLKEVGIQGK